MNTIAPAISSIAKFGLPRQLSSVDEAITMLGMGQVRTLALSSCLNDAFPVVAGLDVVGSRIAAAGAHSEQANEEKTTHEVLLKAPGGTLLRPLPEKGKARAVQASSWGKKKAGGYPALYVK